MYYSDATDIRIRIRKETANIWTSHPKFVIMLIFVSAYTREAGIGRMCDKKYTKLHFTTAKHNNNSKLLISHLIIF